MIGLVDNNRYDRYSGSRDYMKTVITLDWIRSRLASFASQKLWALQASSDAFFPIARRRLMLASM